MYFLSEVDSSCAVASSYHSNHHHNKNYNDNKNHGDNQGDNHWYVNSSEVFM